MKSMSATILLAAAAVFLNLMAASAQDLSDTNRIAQMESARAKTSDQILTLQETVQKLEARLNVISEKLGHNFEQRSSFETIEKRIDTLEKDVERLQRDLDDMDRKLSRMGSQR